MRAIPLIILVLLLSSCSRHDWQAIGYSDRSNPDTGAVALGTYKTEAEARAAGINFTKTHAAGDYIIGPVDKSGVWLEKRR